MLLHLIFYLLATLIYWSLCQEPEPGEQQSQLKGDALKIHSGVSQ
jgi:hypothetical protein